MHEKEATLLHLSNKPRPMAKVSKFNITVLPLSGYTNSTHTVVLHNIFMLLVKAFFALRNRKPVLVVYTTV